MGWQCSPRHILWDIIPFTPKVFILLPAQAYEECAGLREVILHQEAILQQLDFPVFVYPEVLQFLVSCDIIPKIVG